MIGFDTNRMKRKIDKASQASESEPAAPIVSQPKVGRLAPGSTPGQLLVTFDGDNKGPIPARSTVAMDARMVEAAVATHRGVVLLFENGDPGQPIVLALLQPEEGGALLESLLTPAEISSKTKTEARVDGKRVVIEGKDEVVLKCGDASITLRRDGKLVVRGRYVETRADGVNRIKGGSVKIN